MKKIIKLAVLLPFSTVLLTACVATTYKVGEKTYSNRDEASAASKRQDAEAEAAVSAGANPLVNKKLLMAIPTANAFSKTFETIVMKTGKPYSTPGTPARAQDDFLADGLTANLKSVGASLKKSNIYRDLELLDVDTTTPNIQPTITQDVIAPYYSAEGGSFTLYFYSYKFGKQVVAVDTGKATLSERRSSLIDDVKAKALQ